MIRIITLVAVLVVFTAAACKLPADPGDSEATLTTLEGTEWILGRIGTNPPVPGTQVWVTFEEGGAGGYSGCNWFGGRTHTMSGGKIEVEQIEMTARACAEDSKNQQEMVFSRLFRLARSYTVKQDSLHLTIPGNDTTLVFWRRYTLPSRPEALQGSWKFHSMTWDRPVPSVGPANAIRFSGGDYFVETGCARYAGKFTAKGDRFASQQLTALEPACIHVRYEPFEDEVASRVSSAARYLVTPDRLEFYSYAGDTTRFVRAK